MRTIYVDYESDANYKKNAMRKHRNLFIFDFDGTFYDLNDVILINYELQVEFLCRKRNITYQEAVDFFTNHHIYTVVKKDSMSATELFLQMGYDKREWSEFRNSRFEINKIDKSKAIDENTLRGFSQYGILILLSSNAYSVLEKVLLYLDISPSVFKDIICSDKFPYDVPFKKKLAMEYLSKKYNTAWNDIYSIGDRYSTDILPMMELGGHGILIQRPLALKDVLRDMEHNYLLSSENKEYEYFHCL